ncbi:hypothetical protein MUK42_05642 [Musa troglodytarum]|uniref:Transmembrane protein n=1 Tax=Musa troglodytarum TaxID=320322 RepID=A0A9E7EMH3_9LILI|nr:hypothetical protein MUK42_05642 [Musa troglodytarum]
MQRQSLGSPGPAVGAGKEEKRRSINGAAGSAVAAPPEKPEAAFDADKLIRTSTRADRSIHLIPVFTILCLVVLYFFSHEPSHADLQTFSGSALRFDTRGTMLPSSSLLYICLVPFCDPSSSSFRCGFGDGEGRRDVSDSREPSGNEGIGGSEAAAPPKAQEHLALPWFLWGLAEALS